jgi:RNA polymerase sigma-B factor
VKWENEMTTIARPALQSLDSELQRSFLDRDPDTLLTTLSALPRTHPSRQAMRERAIEAWLPLAYHLARRYADRSEPVDDLRQIAALGLIKAIDRFDPAVGNNFVAFAAPTITGEIKRYFRDHSWHVHVRRGVKDHIFDVRQAAELLQQRLHRSPSTAEIAEHLNLSETEVAEAMCAWQAYRPASLERLGDPRDDDLSFSDVLGADEPGYDLVEHRPALAAALAGLDARSREVIRLRYFCDLTQQQIAEHVGVSQMQISRILTKVITDLRSALTVAA